MPVIQNTNQSAQSGFDAAAFMALVQDPTAYAAKLAELEAGRSAAQQAQEEANKVVELVAKAEEIPALFDKAKADASAAEVALKEAQARATQVIDEANQRAAVILKDVESKVQIAQEAWMEKAKELDARSLELDQRENGIQERLSISEKAQSVAEEATAFAREATEKATLATKTAEERFNLINSKFNDFLVAVR